ncbi:hypothetical protein IAG25_40770 [Caballeronia sp. EK]|nr:hypothetical protein [Caballeronia sp. EK]MBC8643048.1 hypothetical protein [Caballeronia sp. EK]
MKEFREEAAKLALTEGVGVDAILTGRSRNGDARFTRRCREPIPKLP